MKVRDSSRRLSKGKQVNIPGPGRGYCVATQAKPETVAGNFHLNAHVASGKLELNHQCVTRVRMRTIMIVLRRFKLLDLDFLIVQGIENSLLY